MHDYAFDIGERRTWYVIMLIATGILNALVNHEVIQQFVQHHLTWEIEVPKVLTSFALVHWFFSNHLWKWSPLYNLPFLNVPDLNGIWEGNLTSSHDGYRHPHEIKVDVSQTWNKIQISLEADQSKSWSDFAAISKSGKQDYILTYGYTNEPKSGRKDTMHMHRGTVRLAVKGNKLEGFYYTGRDRTTDGNIRLHRAA